MQNFSSQVLKLREEFEVTDRQSIFFPCCSSSLPPYTYVLVMGPGQKFLTGSGQVNFLWLGLGRVGSAIYGLGLNFENFP